MATSISQHLASVALFFILMSVKAFSLKMEKFKGNLCSQNPSINKRRRGPAAIAVKPVTQAALAETGYEVDKVKWPSFK